MVAVSQKTGNRALAELQVVTASPTPAPEATATPSLASAPVAPVASVSASMGQAGRPLASTWVGEYFNNRDLVGGPQLVRDDESVQFDWAGSAPAMNLPADGFSARWTRSLPFDAGVYRFSVRADDGVRLSVDGNRVLDEWHDSDASQVYTVDVPLSAGDHLLAVEYYERVDRALIQLSYERTGDLPTATPTATATP